MGQEAHVDENMILELKDVMGEDFHMLLETFLVDSQERLVQLKEAIAAETAEELRHSAHSFKGSSGNIGAPQLSALCRDLEDLGRSGTVEGSAAIFEQLESEFTTVEKIMRSYF